MCKVNEAGMKAIRVHAPGGPDALRYEEIERLTPGPGQVLVKIEAAGANFIDMYQRTGHYKVPLPATLGQEAAGRVIAARPAEGAPAGRAATAGASLPWAEDENTLAQAARGGGGPDLAGAMPGARGALQT